MTDARLQVFDAARNHIAAPLYVVLGHELIHARHNDRGVNQRERSSVRMEFRNREEELTVDGEELSENALRREQGLPARYGHKGGDLAYPLEPRNRP
jgi:hypothetical protein